MLEGISCSGKTSVFKEIKRLHGNGRENERSVIALGEHYSQVLNKTDDGLVHQWACSLGEARRQSRGLFVLFERFYLNHIAAFNTPSVSIENRCNQLGLKCVLLTISDDNIANRIRLRDTQMGVVRTADAIKKQASDYLADQERFVMAINRVSIPSLILNTDSMDWTSFAHDILNFSDST